MLSGQGEPASRKTHVASTPSLLRCFGGIDVSVDLCTTLRCNSQRNLAGPYGRLGVPHYSEEEDAEAGHYSTACAELAEKLDRRSGVEDGRIKKMGLAKSNDKKLSTVSHLMKSSTVRSVACKVKRACEQFVEAAHKGTPHMVELFLSNQLLGQLSAVPPVSFQRSFSLTLHHHHHSPPPSLSGLDGAFPSC